MGLVTEAVMASNGFLYTSSIPLRTQNQLITLFIYAAHLAINGVIIFYALRIGGQRGAFINIFPRGVFVTLVRDLVMIPIIVLGSAFPVFGVLLGAIVWLGLIKYVFQLSWEHSAMVWLISIVLPIVIVLFIVIPIAFVLL